MYYEEINHENGAFKNFLAKACPQLLKDLDPDMVTELVRMVSQGGGFAEGLFKATHNVSCSTILYLL